MADEFPTHRPDVAVLFGTKLPGHGIVSDAVAQLSAAHATTEPTWAGGRALVCDRTGNRLRDQVAAIWHDIRTLWRAKATEYDAIQVRDKVFAGIAGMIRAWQLDIPFFYWMSFPMSESFIAIAKRGPRSLGLLRWMFLSIKGHFGKLLLYRVLLPRCDHVFVQSDHMALSLARRNIPLSRMTPVPMGVDLGLLRDIDPAPASFMDQLRGRRVIAYQGSLDRSRRIDLLFEVLAAVRRHITNCCLVLIGDATEPADREWLEARARQLGVADCIVWTGWVPTSRAWGYLCLADVAVSVIPRGELFDCSSPTKLIEYLALGLPVVVNDLPDQQKVVSESGAGICVSGDVQQVTSAIVRLLQDEHLRAAMRDAGPPYVRTHRNYELLGTMVARTYRGILAG